MFKVFLPEAEGLTRAGYLSTAHVPVIFGPNSMLCREASRYLRDRALGLWSPRSTATRMLRVNEPARRTLIAAADALSIWLRWCHDHRKDWRTAKYADVLAFQRAMTEGDWSLSGKRLAPVTVNLRADEATAFLEWAGVHGLREPFEVPRILTKHGVWTSRSTTGGVVETMTRQNRAKQSRPFDIGEFTLPEPKTMADWLAKVKESRGLAKHLAAKFILATGTRLEETVNVSVDAIPSKERLLAEAAANKHYATVPLEVTKGSVPRSVLVPITFLLELRRWIDTKRLVLSGRWMRRTGEPAPKVLFLSDSPGYEGTPISRSTLYKVFAQVGLGSTRWHPHLGRHAYACYFILSAIEAEALSKGATFETLGTDWVNSRGSTHLKMLQRHLGHADEKTTNTYLQWLTMSVGMERFYLSHQAALDGGAEE